MDGSYNILFNLEKDYENFQKIVSEKERRKLISYLNEKRFSEVLINLYYSGLQGNKEALITLGYKHWKGIGTPTNCTSAALYYDQVLKDLYKESQEIPRIVENHRLDKYLQNKSNRIFNDLLEGDKLTIFRQINLDLNQLQDMQYKVTLANSYYMGLGGLKQDYFQAFKIYQELHTLYPNSNEISALLGKMYLLGQGTEKNYQMAKQLFTTINKAEDNGVALNCLGYMHYHGLGVNKDFKKAIQYFKQSVQKGDIDALYNLGSLLIMPGNEYLARDFVLGQKYLIKAAESGHGQAQYALALLYLDGVDYYQNCEVSVNLMKTASSKGPWLKYQKQGNYYFSKGHYRQAQLNYLQSAVMGEEVGLLNTGIVADKFEGFNDNDIDYNNLQQSLDQDPVYKIIKQQKKLRYTNLQAFLHSDLLQILQSNHEIQERYEVLEKILVPPNKSSINEYIAMKCHSLSYSDFIYSSNRLGDFYYHGIYENQSYQQAFQFYKISSQSQQKDGYLPQAYYNLGYMTLHGLGTQKNLSISEVYFDHSVDKNPYIKTFKNLLRVLVKAELYLEQVKELNLDYFLDEFIPSLGADSIVVFLSRLFFIILILTFFGTYFTKLRIQNKQKLDIKQLEQKLKDLIEAGEEQNIASDSDEDIKNKSQKDQNNSMNQQNSVDGFLNDEQQQQFFEQFTQKLQQEEGGQEGKVKKDEENEEEDDEDESNGDESEESGEEEEDYESDSNDKKEQILKKDQKISSSIDSQPNNINSNKDSTAQEQNKQENDQLQQNIEQNNKEDYKNDKYLESNQNEQNQTDQFQQNQSVNQNNKDDENQQVLEQDQFNQQNIQNIDQLQEQNQGQENEQNIQNQEAQEDKYENENENILE